MSDVERIRVTPEIVLSEGGLDVEERFAKTPRDYTIRGMFFASLVRDVGDDWPVIAKELLAPPDDGQYATLGDYPQIDHARLAVAAARKRHPDVSLREGLRRIERGAASAFAQSTIGHVVGMFAEPLTLFRVLPDLHHHMQRGGTMRYVTRGTGARIELREFAPWLDCSMLGAIEGVVVLFGKRPFIEITLHSNHDADFDIDWR
jgi:uncharacterized protein (TIGR02265 family)